MDSALLGFRLACDAWFISPFLSSLLKGDRLSDACPTTVVWKCIMCPVSQVHSWRGVLPQNKSWSDTDTWFTWDWELPLMLEWVQTLGIAQVGGEYVWYVRRTWIGGRAWGWSVMSWTVFPPNFTFRSFKPQDLRMWLYLEIGPLFN